MQISHDVQIGVVTVFVFLLDRIQWRVMIHRRLVSRVIIVAENVEPVQVLVELRHVVALLDVLEARRHRHGEQQPRPAGLVVFALELLAQLLHQLGVVVAILRLAAVAERRVLWRPQRNGLCNRSMNMQLTPIQVQTVELVLTQKLDCVFHQLTASLGAGDQRRESRRTFVPTCSKSFVSLKKSRL